MAGSLPTSSSGQNSWGCRAGPLVTNALPSLHPFLETFPARTFSPFSSAGRGRKARGDAAAVVLRLTGFSEMVKWEPRHTGTGFPPG